jgi:hypothetical protein
VIEHARDERVLDQVSRCVGGRQRDGDDEIGGRESQQAQDDRLAPPAGEQALENHDAALTVRAHVRDAAVHRQRAEQGQQDQYERRDRGEVAGSEERDAGLIREGGEVVDAGEAHDTPPRRGVRGLRVRADGFVVALK